MSICRFCLSLLVCGCVVVAVAGCDSTSANGANRVETTPTTLTSDNGTSTKSTSDKEPDATSEVATVQSPNESGKALPSLATVGRVAAGRAIDITFDDLKFPIKPDQPYDSALLTKQVLGYVGQNVRVRGYILPTFQEQGIREFVLVRDNQECCFGPGAALFDCIRVQMDEDNPISFSHRPVSVEGRFDIQEMRDYEDVTRAVFFLSGKEVK